MQNCTPRQEFPFESSAGDQRHIPSVFGTTNKMHPETPDFAGSPTY